MKVELSFLSDDEHKKYFISIHFLLFLEESVLSRLVII